MKRFGSILLAVLMLLCALTACGSPDGAESSAPVSVGEGASNSTTTSASAETTVSATESTQATTIAATTTEKPLVKPVTATTTTTTKATQATTKATTRPQEKTAVKITAIAGPTGVGMAALWADAEAKKTANDYTFNLVSDPTLAVAAITSGSADIAAVPTNLAATLYKKTSGKVQVLAVNTLGVLYMLDCGAGISSVQDLKGKEIYTSGQGANPEYILNYVLEKNGLDPKKDVTIRFVEDNDALVAAIVQGKAQVAMVPEPKVTACLVQMKGAGKSVQVALNMTEEWNRVAGGSSTLMMGCVIARRDFVEKNPAAVQAFLQEYKASIETVKADVAAAAKLCETYKIIPKAAIAQQAIPRCNLTFISGAQMKTQLSGYLNVLYTANKASIGGAMPADDFYYAG